MRWPETEGEAICPRCGCLDSYDIPTRRKFQCKACGHQGSGWDELHAGWKTRRVNHSVAFMDEGVCTNQAESFFSRLRRAEIGTHHHIAGPYLNAYASEMSWREDNRRVSNGTQAVMAAGAAMASRVSRQWAGYWQRAA